MPITFLDEEDNTGIDDTSLIPSIQPKKRKVTFLDEEPEEEVGTLQGIANTAQNALDSSQQALLAVGGVDEDQAKKISELEYAKQARKAAPGYAEYQKAEGWDAVGAFLKNPVEVTTNIIGEGLAGSLPALGAGLTAGAAGAAVGSVVPGIGTGIGYTAGQVAGTFGGSLSTEYGSKILEELQNSGMDITDPNSIQSYFSDEEKLAPIREKALLRGVPVAAFDAVSAGIGGKLGRVFGSEIIKEGEKVLGKKFATKTGEALTELGAQAVLGGGGEVAGSVAAGDEVNLKDVFAEVIGEVGTGSIEVLQGKIADRANQRKLIEAKANQDILNLSETLEQNNAPQTARATTQELAKQLSDDLNVDREEEAVELAELGGQTLKKINEVKTETQTATTKEEVATNLSEEDLNAREQDAEKLVQQYKDAYFESQDPNDRAKAVEFQGVLDAIQVEKRKRSYEKGRSAPTQQQDVTTPTAEEVVTPTTGTEVIPLRDTIIQSGIPEEAADIYIDNLKGEGLNEDQIREIADNNKSLREEAARKNEEESIAKRDLAQRARMGDKEARAQLEGERGILATPTTEDITAVPPVAETATLPVEQAPLTQQAVAQQVETQPYATQEIIQPEVVRQEPQDGTQIGKKPETIISDSLRDKEKSVEGLIRDRNSSMGVAYPAVFDRIKDLKVAQSVVSDLPVDVVNLFGGKEGASQVLLNNPSVFQDTLAVLGDANIPRLIGDPYIIAVANLRTKLLNSLSAGGNKESISALEAANRTLGEVMGTLSLGGRELGGEPLVSSSMVKAAPTAEFGGILPVKSDREALSAEEAILSGSVSIPFDEIKVTEKKPQSSVSYGLVSTPTAEGRVATTPPPVAEAPAAEVATIQRDMTKPEQMTPEELWSSRYEGNAPSLSKGAEDVWWNKATSTPSKGSFTTHPMMASEKDGKFLVRLGSGMKSKIKSFNSKREAFLAYKRQGAGATGNALIDVIEGTPQKSDAIIYDVAVKQNKPISTKAVELYNIQLPEGYTKQGDLYVYQPAVSETITPAAPTGPQVGRIGTEDQIKNADQHAAEMGGSVLYQDGDISLIRGYSLLGGNPVYIVSNKEMRARNDISSYAGNLVTTEQKAQLIDLKNKIESKDQESFNNNPFITFSDGISFSNEVPESIAGILKGWKSLLNIKANVYVTTYNDVLLNRDKFNGPHRVIGSSALDSNKTDGSMRKMPNGDFYIMFRTKPSKTKMLETLSHELGHLHEKEAYKNADEKTQTMLRDEHSKWLKSQTGKTAQEFISSLRAVKSAKSNIGASEGMMADDLSAYWKSFGEWYADQVSRWAVSKEEPLTIVDKFFSKIAKALKSFYSNLKNQGYLPNETFVQYLEKTLNQPERIVSEETTQESQVDESMQPTGPQVGQRVRSGSTPQPFVITEVTPQTARDVELGEQYYKIKNERTGEISVVESVDITPVKTTRSSKKLKAVYPSKGGVEVGDMNVSQRMEALAKITPKTPEEETAFQKALSNKMMARNPELAIAAVRLKNGEITAGEYADLIDIIDPFTIKGFESIPTKSKIDQYIDEGKKNKVNAPIENGKEVEFRIDIPTYNRSTAAGDTIYAVTAHEPVPEASKRVGIPISYVGVAKVINPKMMTRSISGKGEAIDIATGSGKFPLATVKGNYEAITELPADINDPNAWTEVSYNPIRSSYFVDVRSKNAVVGGEEAIMVGSRVFVKNPQTQARPTGVVGGNGVTDIRYARARDKAKYRQKYKSAEVLTKINNYIKNGLVEMKEAGDNGNVELIEEISKKIDFASKYNINESELYSEKELEDGVRNFFKGNIPSNVIFTNDIGDDSYASYVLNTGEIEINRAYFKRDVNIDAIIGHELGHFAFGDPEFQKIFTSFWDDLTQEQRDAISEYVEENYSALSPDLRNEEKVIRAWQALLEQNPEIRSKWQNFVEAVKRFLNKYFSTSYEVNDSDKFVLNVLNAIRQDFISGKKMLREDGTDFKLQAKAQVHGQKEAGRELNSFIGGEKIVQDIVRQNYFDSTQFSDENTQKAYDLLQSLTDFTDGNNNDFAIKLNEDIQSKLKDQDVHPDIKQVIGVQILRNELQRYSNKLLVSGDSFFEKIYKINANDIPLGIKDVTSSNIARALGAIAKINNPMIGAIQAQGKGEVVQLASTTFGTKEPSTEQINVIEEALKESGKAETIDNADILDSVVSAESKTGVNIRKDIDATIKKSGVKQKTVDDVIGSTETGKTEFAGVDASTAKASIKKQATSPIDAQAERAIEGLAKLQSDVQAWPNKTQNQVRSIVQQDLRQRPDMARKEAWKSLLTSKLMNAGVSESNAMTLSDLIWKQHEINNMNREIKLIESAAENGSLGVIIEMIKNTPLQQQSTPEWRKEVIRQYLMSAGLSEKQAESAARLYDNIIAEKIAEAKQKAFEQSISKTSPWRDHMSRNGQLAKDALKKVLNAVRTSALDPTQNTESIIAKQNGWTGFSEADFRRIAEIDEILNNKETDDLKKAELMKELNEIISKTKLPVTVKQALAAFYTGQALMGIPTVTVNVFSPLGFSLRNLVTDIGRFAVTDPTRIPLAFDTFLDSMRSWYNQTKYAFKNEVYPNDVVEYLNGNNVLKELYNKGKKEWKNGEYGSGMRDMLVGMTQITGRVLSALDQGAISALENQAVNRYAMEAMSLSNIPRSKRNAVARQILQAKRNTYASLIAGGMEKERAGVLADMEMKNEIKKQLSSLNIESEKVNNVINSALNDALLSVGRNRTISMDGLTNEQKRLSDDGMISYLPIKFLEQIASSSAQQGPLMQVFSKMLYGFALVPARAFHNAAWYSPYGFLRIFRDKYQKSKGMESSYSLSLGNELQYRQRLTESIAGSLVMLGLGALVKSSTDDEDDDKFKIVVTGNGPDAAADKQYYDSWIKKWKPYSIHIVMGDTVIPINIGRGGEAIFFPILIAGALDDWNIRNQMNKAKKKPADLNQATVMLGSAFLALAQRGPYAAFGKSLFNANRAGQLPEEVAAQAGYFGKTFVPILGTSLARNISDFINDPIDRSSMSGAIYSNIPIVGPMIGTKALNAFGQPIRADDWGDKLYKLGVPMVFSFPKNTPMNELNELVLSKGDGPTIPTRRTAEARLERPMTNEEFYAYVKTYGDYVSKRMFRSRKSLERMDASRYQSQLEEYSQDASERATRAVKRISIE